MFCPDSVRRAVIDSCTGDPCTAEAHLHPSSSSFRGSAPTRHRPHELSIALPMTIELRHGSGFDHPHLVRVFPPRHLPVSEGLWSNNNGSVPWRALSPRLTAGTFSRSKRTWLVGGLEGIRAVVDIAAGNATSPSVKTAIAMLSDAGRLRRSLLRAAQPS